MNENYAIELRSVTKSFGKTKVVKNLSLQLPSKKVYGLIGESGSGKTTCLRLMNGLLQPDSGEVLVNGVTVDDTNSAHLRKSMGYAMQGSGLFPHMTVGENLRLVAKYLGWDSTRLRQRADEVLKMVALNPEEFLDKYPRQMSGGQKQRVGIARSLFCRPQILIMDEPFGALDPITREDVQDLILKLQKLQQLTVVIVTHDLAEAYRMADRLILLNRGQIEQVGTPSQLMNAPKTNFAAQFLKSHSPGNVLKSIKLRSMINSQVAVVKEGAAREVLVELSGKRKSFSSKAEAFAFLQTQAEEYCIVLSGKRQFEHFVQLQGGEVKPLSILPLYFNDDCQVGMVRLLSQEVKIIPIINEKQEYLGCFSEDSLKNI